MVNFFKSLFTSSKSEQETTEEQIQAPPKNFDTFKYDGLRAQRMGRLDFAIKCYHEALGLMKDYETLQFLVSAYTQSHELEDALDTTAELIELEPDNKDGYLVRMNLLYMLERLEETLEQALFLIEKEPDLFEPHFMKGKVEHDLKRHEEAIASLTKAIQLKEDLPALYYSRAKAYYSLPNLEAALADTDRAIELHPEDELFYMLKGVIHQEMKDDEAALENFLRVLELNPFHHQASLYVGNIYSRTDRKEQAMELYDDLLEMGEEFSALHEARAVLYDEQGEADKAKEEREKAAALRAEEGGEEVSDEKVNFDNMYKGGIF